MRKWDRFEQNMQLRITDVREDGITVQGESYRDFNNVYGIAHGGYLYTVAHIASQITGDVCLGGKWDVASAECLYLHPLRIYPSVTKTVWINKEEQYPMLCAKVHDNQGALCFELNATLKPAAEHTGESVVHTPTILTELLPPKNPYDEVKVPCLSTTFSRWLNIYTTKKEEESLVYSVDLVAKNCDDFGYVHPAALFTAADCAVGGSLFYIDKKRPITVSANIHYFQSSCCGPVQAVPRPVRRGRILNFYDVDLIDGKDCRVGVAQFIIRDMDQ